MERGEGGGRQKFRKTLFNTRISVSFHNGKFRTLHSWFFRTPNSCSKHSSIEIVFILRFNLELKSVDLKQEILNPENPVTLSYNYQSLLARKLNNTTK
jgi:hypothetical protein